MIGILPFIVVLPKNKMRSYRNINENRQVMRCFMIIIMACIVMSVNPISAKHVNKSEVTAEARQVEAFEPEDTPQTSGDDDAVISLEDVCYPPEFPGGTEAMYQWIGINFQYPPSAADEGFRTRIVLKFVVTRTGDVDNVTVHHPDPALRKEAIRVVNAMPKWTPGRNCDEEPVNVAFILPIQFRISPE